MISSVRETFDKAVGPDVVLRGRRPLMGAVEIRPKQRGLYQQQFCSITEQAPYDEQENRLRFSIGKRAK